jgi:2-phosphosulfolactate phosphatase
VEGLPVPGVAISNSPTMVRDADLAGKVLVQRTSSGTQAAVAAAAGAEELYAASLVVASATAGRIQAARPEVVTLVASGADRGHPEDEACAAYLEALLLGRRADLPALLGPLLSSDRYACFLSGSWPGFPPSDLRLALTPDRFDFAMPVERDELGLRITARAT